MARLCWHGRNQVRAAGFSNQKFSTRTRPNPVRVCVRFAFGKRVHDGERVLMEAWRVRQGEPGSCGASIARLPRRVPNHNLFADQDMAPTIQWASAGCKEDPQRMWAGLLYSSIPQRIPIPPPSNTASISAAQPMKAGSNTLATAVSKAAALPSNPTRTALTKSTADCKNRALVYIVYR